MKIAYFLIIVVGMAGCSFQHSSRDAKQREDWEWKCGQKMESEMDKQVVDTTNFTVELRQFIITNGTVTGQWDSCCWHDSIHLTITSRNDGKYDVLYFVRGDLMSWRQKRIARFEDGVLEFDRPVMEYLSEPYKHFYLIQTPHGIRLASQSVIRYAVLGKKPEDWNSLTVDESMLIKKGPNNGVEPIR